MVVMTLERTSRRLRGVLTRWMIEIERGVYIGRLSAAVRDLLWLKCIEESGSGRCCQMFSSQTEQGYTVRSNGPGSRYISDFDGLQLNVCMESKREGIEQTQK